MSIKVEEYSPFDWDIRDWDYRNGEFHVSFQDGTQGSVPVSAFPALEGVPESELNQVRVCPWYVVLHKPPLEWEVSESELYKRVNGPDRQAQVRQKYMREVAPTTA